MVLVCVYLQATVHNLVTLLVYYYIFITLNTSVEKHTSHSMPSSAQDVL